MKFFTTPNSKNIIATLRIVTIEKSVLAFLLILYFHANMKYKLMKFPLIHLLLLYFILLSEKMYFTARIFNMHIISMGLT